MDTDVLSAVVHPWHVDIFRHMNVRWYAHFFDDASFQFWSKAGLDLQKMEIAYRVHVVTVSAQTEFRQELVAGDCLNIKVTSVGLGNKSVKLAYEMRTARTGEVHAIYRAVDVVVDATTHTSTEIPAAMRNKLSKFELVSSQACA